MWLLTCGANCNQFFESYTTKETLSWTKKNPVIYRFKWFLSHQLFLSRKLPEKSAKLSGRAQPLILFWLWSKRRIGKGESPARWNQEPQRKLDKAGYPGRGELCLNLPWRFNQSLRICYRPETALHSSLLWTEVFTAVFSALFHHCLSCKCLGGGRHFVLLVPSKLYHPEIPDFNLPIVTWWNLDMERDVRLSMLQINSISPKWPWPLHLWNFLRPLLSFWFLNPRDYLYGSIQKKMSWLPLMS